MPEPKTIRHWLERGYSFVRRGECPACLKPVELFRTTAGADVPLDPQTYETHFSNCDKARQYRTEKRMEAGVP